MPFLFSVLILLYICGFPTLGPRSKALFSLLSRGKVVKIQLIDPLLLPHLPAFNLTWWLETDRANAVVNALYF